MEVLPFTVFDPTTPFPSSHQHLTESDKIVVNFARSLNTAMSADGLWAIKIPNFAPGAEQFHEVLLRNRSLAYLNNT